MILTNDNEESRRVVESCYKHHRTVINPIIDWIDDDVWEFIKTYNIPYCGLYDEGLKRLGCIGCPLAGKKAREAEFLRWPTYKRSYIKAFGKMLNERAKKGLIDGSWRMGTTPMDVFNWWMEYDILPGQMDLFEEDTE